MRSPSMYNQYEWQTFLFPTDFKFIIVKFLKNDLLIELFTSHTKVKNSYAWPFANWPDQYFPMFASHFDGLNLF